MSGVKYGEVMQTENQREERASEREREGGGQIVISATRLAGVVCPHDCLVINLHAERE